MIKQFPQIISVLIFGIIIFQSFLVAPSINKLISTEEARILLRYIWPKFFLIISILSIISILILYSDSNHSNSTKYYMIISFVLMISCFFITPIINNAKDTSNEQMWMLLHLSTIILTFITLILNTINILFWKY